MERGSPNYKIRQVTDLTGVSEFLLRVWEYRYSALKPTRTKTGRRLYTESDLLKARALLALTQQGCRVGDIAQKSLSELNQMLRQSVSRETAPGVDANVKKIIAKANAFKWSEVRTLVVQRKQKPLSWIHNLIVPLLAEVGRQVNEGGFSIAQEHILSALIKASLASNLRSGPTRKNGPRIVFAAPEGDFHDLGLWIGSFIASELKVNTLFIGPHVPKAELAAVCLRYNATHLLLSSTAETRDGHPDHYLNYLHFLDRNLDSKITIWLAGRNAQKYPVTLSRPYQVMDSFINFEREVKKCIN